MSEQDRPICDIAREIQSAWSKKGKGVNFAAKPYLEAMMSLGSITDKYGCDSAKSVVIYFLQNASSYRGDEAKSHKSELKRIAGIK